MSTGEKIKMYRVRMGMTQTELANKLGLRKTAISKWENNQVVNIKRDTLSKLAAIFGVSVAHLVDDYDEHGLKRNEVGVMFEQLNEEGQQRAIEYMHMLIQNGYIKSNEDGMVEKDA